MKFLAFLLLTFALLVDSKSGVLKHNKHTKKENPETYRKALQKTVHRNHRQRQLDEVTDEETDTAFNDFEKRIEEWETAELEKAQNEDERTKTRERFQRYKETIPPAREEAREAKRAGRLEKAQSYIDAATSTAEAIPALINNDGDPLHITQNVLNLVAGIAPIFGPYGEALSGILGLFSTTLGMFDQTTETPIEDVVAEVIDKKLKEYDDNEMRRKAAAIKNEFTEDRALLNVFTRHTLDGTKITSEELAFLHREIQLDEGADFIGYLKEKLDQDCFQYFAEDKRVWTGQENEYMFLWEAKARPEYTEAMERAETCMEFFAFFADVVGLRDVRKMMLYNLFKKNTDSVIITESIWMSKKSSLDQAYSVLEHLVYAERCNYPIAMRYEPHNYPRVETALKLIGVDKTERDDWKQLNQHQLFFLPEENLYKKEDQEEFGGWTAVEDNGKEFVIAMPKLYDEAKIQLHPAGPLGYFYFEFVEFPGKFAKADTPGGGTWPRITLDAKPKSELGDEHQFRIISVTNYGRLNTHIVSPKSWGKTKSICFKTGTDVTGNKDPKLNLPQEDLGKLFVLDSCDNIPGDFFVILTV